MQDASGYSALHHAALNGHKYVSKISRKKKKKFHKKFLRCKKFILEAAFLINILS